MSRSVVPVNIRPHLVPFLYQEFEGIEANYLSKKVKAAKISTRSVFGKVIRLLMVKADKPLQADKFQAFLSVQNSERNQFFGHFYKSQNGTHTFLRLPEAGAKLINDYLEDVFRLALVSFIVGYTSSENQKSLFEKKRTTQEAINVFMDTYNLREHGFSAPTLQKYYEREVKNNASCRRIQTAVSNRGLNYV
ncbi:hypothetical protein JJL45_05265 [Tamlana sp. s12]|uniref:hypothetical protein n=1 Tax=Tamlana sp. s12 TaxID=1630406 RepID=UPI0007FFDBB4|nr:hypothetical protein [Tamlana sp. s12]OBQ56086.1 hypothetical protein VQ01_06795 [Tamlana sp. s12]QQY83401.1 hypothetical protein JJL45_05265 [Tamlana sp. s12]